MNEKDHNYCCCKEQSNFPVWATLFIGIAGIISTYIYNNAQTNLAQRQFEIQKLETLGKCSEFVSSKDGSLRLYGYHALSKLEEHELAAQMIISKNDADGARYILKLFDSKNISFSKEDIEKVIDISMATSTSTLEKSDLPKNLTSNTVEGKWVYIGHWVKKENNWKNKYFEIDTISSPKNIKNKKISVSKNVGTVNVRDRPPSSSGNLGNILGTVSYKSEKLYTVEKIENWADSGYIWAKISNK